MGFFESLIDWLDGDKVIDEIAAEEKAVEEKAAEEAVEQKADNELSGKALQELTDLSKAITVLSIYAAGCDGNISVDEYMEMDIAISKLNNKYHIPDKLRKELMSLTEYHNMEWEDVKTYLDKVSVDKLGAMKNIMNEVVKVSGDVSAAEQAVCDQFSAYIESRN